MAVDFPNNPAVNQLHIEQGSTWKWTGSAWAVVGSEGELTEIVEADMSQNWQVVGDMLIITGVVTLTALAVPSVAFIKKFKKTPYLAVTPYSTAIGLTCTFQSHSENGFVGQMWDVSAGAQLGDGYSYHWVAIGEALDADKKPKSVVTGGGPSAAQFLPLTGGTLTGTLQVGTTDGNEYVKIEQGAEKRVTVAGSSNVFLSMDEAGGLGRLYCGTIGGPAPKDITFNPTTSTVEFPGIVTAHGSVFVKAPAGAPAHLWFEDVNKVQRGLMYWNHQTGDLQLQRREANGAINGEMALTGTQFYVTKSVFTTDRYKGPESNEGARIQGYANSSTVGFGWISPNFMGTVDSGGATMVLGTTSDHRIKNVTGELGDALAVINKLRPVEYTIKPLEGALAHLNKQEDAEKPFAAAPIDTHVGLIAHEVQEHIPSAVVGEKDDPDRLQSVTYQLLVPHLIKAVQQLTARVAELEGKL